MNEETRDDLVANLKDTLKTWYPDGTKCSDYGRIVNEFHFDRLQKMRSEIDENQIVILDEKNSKDDRSERHMAPILNLLKKPEDLPEDETFGPILHIMVMESMDKAIDFINARPQPLACYIFSDKAAMWI